MPDYDARFVQLYDADNPDGPDHDFFRSLADQVGARTVVDLGCGTGILTVTLHRPGRTVVGIDPSSTMLAHARHRLDAEHVSWILGDSRAIGDARADLVLMTGNTAQHITGPAWRGALRDIHHGLRPGGHLAFERRNPAARAWQDWTPEKTTATRDTPVGRLREWYEVVDAEDDGDVTFASHTVFTATGEHIVATQTLSFRNHADVTADLDAAGFDVIGTWSGWNQQPLQPDSPLMVFHAQRR